MSVHVTGTANPNPVTQVTSPTGTASGPTGVVGSPVTVTVGPYTNNSAVSLRALGIVVTNLAGCTLNSFGFTSNGSVPAPSFTVGAGNNVSVQLSITPTATSYSFDVDFTWAA